MRNNTKDYGLTIDSLSEFRIHIPEFYFRTDKHSVVFARVTVLRRSSTIGPISTISAIAFTLGLIAAVPAAAYAYGNNTQWQIGFIKEEENISPATIEIDETGLQLMSAFTNYKGSGRDCPQRQPWITSPNVKISRTVSRTTRSVSGVT
jgi:hypothetical protein